MLVNFKVIFV